MRFRAICRLDITDGFTRARVRHRRIGNEICRGDRARFRRAIGKNRDATRPRGTLLVTRGIFLANRS